MLGLLYKDYIAVKGKYYLAALFGQFLLVTLIRLLVVDDTVDIIMAPMILVVLIGAAIAIPFSFEVSLIKADEGRKQKQYFLSLPVSRRQYVASKYIFLAITFYVIQSVAIFEFLVCQVNLKLEETQARLSGMQMLVPTCISHCMIVCALELPFFIGMGVKKGNAVKQGIFFLFCFAFIAYMMFGDLSVFDKFDLMSVLDYLMQHTEIMLAGQILFPVVAIILFYLSYLVSARLFERKEWEDE